MERKVAAQLQLPQALVSRSDAARTSRQLEALTEALDQAKMRQQDANLQVSPLLQELAELNKLDLNQTNDRQQLADLLRNLSKNGQSIHISFAAQPSNQVTDKLVDWFRQQVDPLLLLEIGLQPSIAAGCIVRTPSKYFDFSMRQHLLRNRKDLVERLKVTP
jgi:F0F1-type ATP synthase delta subunit